MINKVKTEEYLLTALQAGADYYVLKDATQDELVTAIKNLMEGKFYFSPGVSEKIIEGYLNEINKWLTSVCRFEAKLCYFLGAKNECQDSIP